MDDVQLLQSLSSVAEEAGTLAIESRKKLIRELKPDGSIVTNGDVAVENFLRPHLAKLVPEASIWGEEGGFQADEGRGLWLVDPIDGTSNYAFGSPLWGVSIGLMTNGQISHGVIVLPEFGETYSASRSTPATLNGKKLPPIPPGAIKREELLGYDERLLHMFPHGNLPGKMRHIGAFVIEAAWVATQRMRGMIAVRGKLYDFAAGICIARKLGADVRYFDGTPIIDAELVTRDRDAKPIAIVPAGSDVGIGWVS